MGFAIAEEAVGGLTRDKWIRPLHGSGDPIRTVMAMVRETSVRIEDVRCGCPLNSLAQEMPLLDEQFQKRAVLQSITYRLVCMPGP